jgi:hypothetical protein
MTSKYPGVKRLPGGGIELGGLDAAQKRDAYQNVCKVW